MLSACTGIPVAAAAAAAAAVIFFAAAAIANATVTFRVCITQRAGISQVSNICAARAEDLHHTLNLH
jgi:hypothetical protein